MELSDDELISVNVKEYFEEINSLIEQTYKIAEQARKKGYDPSIEVEIPIAKDIADRVEGLIGPKGVGKRIRELEKEGLSRESVAFRIAEEIATGKFFSSEKVNLAEQAIRTSLAIITESITAAPLEGIAKVKIKQNDDGSDYLAVYYAGPIRSAGGTAAGMSVLLADHIRRALKLDRYKPTEREIERMVEEIDLYNKVMHLQLPTTKEEQRFAARNLPIEITGEPTEQVEVSGNRDLKRVETNRLRGGACLVFNDGIVGRVKKLEKRVSKHKLEGWDWFSELIQIHASQNVEDSAESDKEKVSIKQEIEQDNLFIKPDTGYIQDVIGGRPVFSHPSAKGGFRIRYGRSRTTGLAAMGVHPALFAITNDFLVCGTHLRTERPGKGAIVMPVDSIHPPIVLLKDGTVCKVNSYEEGIKLKDQIEKILFLGDMLYGVGEFNQFNHDLVPSGYCEEWWAKELEKQLMNFSEKEINQFFRNKKHKFDKFIKEPLTIIPTAEEAIGLSLLLDIPLHPEYTYHWNDISISAYIQLREYISLYYNNAENLEIPNNEKIKHILEEICIPHSIKEDKILFGEHSQTLLISLGFKNGNLLPIENKAKTVVQAINFYNYIQVRDKCPCYTGARMGRPEKAKSRKMKPPVHLLFPIGEAGGNQRNIVSASEKNIIEIELVQRKCPICGSTTHLSLCSRCNVVTEIVKFCPRCGLESNNDKCKRCGIPLISYKTRPFPINEEFRKIARGFNSDLPKNVKAVKKLMNKHRIPEFIIKGILRSINNVFVYRDGTIRFDATDAIITHFRPREIGVSVSKLHSIGYTHDIYGILLENEDQLLELKIQDVIVNKEGGKYLLQVSHFIDELLKRLYGLPPFYNAKTMNDLVGHLIIGLAPHTSAGIAGRLIGFTEAKVILAHPYWHAAKRRNCLFPSEQLLIWDEKKQQVIVKSIGEIVEEELKAGAKSKLVDDFGTFVIENLHKEWKVISLDQKSSSPILQPIKHWIKGKSEKWLQIKTKSGSEITVTPEHNMLVLNEQTNNFEKVKARILQEGEYIAVKTKIPELCMQPKKTVNILEELAKNLPDSKKFAEFKHAVRLRKAGGWIQNKIEIFCSKLSQENKSKTNSSSCTKIILNYILSKGIDVPHHTYLFSNHWFDSIPLSHLELLQKEGVFKWHEIPFDARLGMARDDFTVAPYFPFNKELMKILGYYISEGHIRDNKNCYQVNFSVPDEKIREHLVKIIKRNLGITPYISEKRNVICSGRILAYLFAYAWNMGKGAYSKRLPNFLYTLPNDYKFAFISAYLDGDGTLSKDVGEISFYSVSNELLKDITYLFSTIGVFVRSRVSSPEGHYGKKVLANYKKLGKEPKKTVVHKISIRGADLWIMPHLDLINQIKKEKLNQFIIKGFPKKRRIKYNNQYYELKEAHNTICDQIAEINSITKEESSYCLEVKTIRNDIMLHNFQTTSCITMNCDGDEDSILLALDAFLNFSKFFLPEVRGGQMDAPLILVSTIDPFEVDDESHNVDTGNSYPLSFYESTLNSLPAKKVLPLIDIVSHRLSTKAAYEGFSYSHETSSIFVGEKSSLYTRLATMKEKVDAQLELATKIRAVDVDDVATRVIFKQFLPDLIGNMRRFGSQKIRCTNCNATYRRIPLAGYCPKCGASKLNLTVFEKSVTKYLSIIDYLVSKYSVSEYLRSRIDVLKQNILTMFLPDDGSTDKKSRRKTRKTGKKKTSVNLSDFLLEQ
ncbi:MAG: DNA polymerase II large subunit [Candidatus Heimdallarchaeaceae archaeon]